jgi:molybdopterin molybdotransferase
VTTTTHRNGHAASARARRHDAVEWHDARRLAWEAGAALPVRSELLDLSTPRQQAGGSAIVASDLRARTALPGFDSSAMDGWALGPGDGPWLLGDPVPMGGAPDRTVMADGTARPITTGGPVPAGTTAVLRSEDGATRGRLLHALRPTPPGSHIRRAGEESALGEVLVRAGDDLTPPRRALLAAGGHDLVPVRRSPRITVLTLGDEILAHGVPEPGRVRDVFGPSVPGILESLGGVASAIHAVRDDLDETMGTLDAALHPEDASRRPDMVVTTGGTAGGTGDHLRAALDRLGARVVIDGVAVRPGHPLVLATLPDGRIVLALPGNPMAGLTGLVAMGGPLVAGLLGRAFPSLGSAVSADALPNPTRSTRLVACVREAGAGLGAGAPHHAALRLLPLGRQGSAMLRGLAAAEAVAVVPPGGTAPNSVVETLPLPW